VEIKDQNIPNTGNLLIKSSRVGCEKSGIGKRQAKEVPWLKSSTDLSSKLLAPVNGLNQFQYLQFF